MRASLIIFMMEVRKDPAFRTIAHRMDADLRTTDAEGITDKNIRKFVDGVEWIAKQSRPLGERVDAICKLAKVMARNPGIINMRDFTGWKSDIAPRSADTRDAAALGTPGAATDLFGEQSNERPNVD
jgi:hypothetical protein